MSVIIQCRVYNIKYKPMILLNKNIWSVKCLLKSFKMKQKMAKENNQPIISLIWIIRNLKK